MKTLLHGTLCSLACLMLGAANDTPCFIWHLLDAAPAPASMPTTHQGQLELPNKGKRVPWIVDLPPDDRPSTLALCLAHGAGGDASSGNLPALAAACAAAGVPCLRFTARGGSLQHRINVTKVMQGVWTSCSDWPPPND